MRESDGVGHHQDVHFVSPDKIAPVYHGEIEGENDDHEWSSECSQTKEPAIFSSLRDDGFHGTPDITPRGSLRKRVLSETPISPKEFNHQETAPVLILTEEISLMKAPRASNMVSTHILTLLASKINPRGREKGTDREKAPK